MKKKLLYSTLLLGSMLWACTDGSEPLQTVVTQFPVEKELQATVIKTSPVILAPQAMFIINGQLWIQQSQTEKIFWVFSLPDCNFLYSTGSYGRGPNEFLSPSGNTIQVHENGTITLLDNFVMKTLQPGGDGNIRTIAEERIFDLVPINGFNRLDDSLYCAFADCATGTTGDKEYRMADKRTKTEVKFSDYPKLTGGELAPEVRCQLYYKNLVSNPQAEKIAAFYTFFKFIRFYNYSGELEKEISVEIPPFKSTLDTRQVFYTKPVSTDKFIYVQCIPDELQIWDWDGNPVASLRPDKKFFCYTVDPMTDRLYAVGIGEGLEGTIYTYDLRLD